MDLIFDAGLTEAFPIHRLEPLALGLYLALTLLFFGYYGWRYYKRGIFTIDSYFVTLMLYIPIVFIFPFAFSELNSLIATGSFHEAYLPYLHHAFYIGALGIGFFIVGAIIAHASRGSLPGIGAVSHSLKSFWVTKIGIGFGALSLLLLLVLMVMLGFEVGNARATAMERPSLRPIYNLFHTLVSFVALNIFVYGYWRSRSRYYLVGLLVALIGIFGGTRAASVGILISFAALWMMTTRYRNLLAPLLIAGFGLPLMIYVGGLRHGHYDLSQVAATPAIILYGNNFSDLRDFAWILSGWDHVFVHGRTQLAGFLSFIPSNLSEFRSTWAWGQFSVEAAGLDDVTGHPGLRPTIFGEAYFNYGYAGAALAGFLSGFVVFKLASYVAAKINRYGPRGAAINVLAALTYLSLFASFLTTAGFFGFHITLLALLLGGLVFSAVRQQRLRQRTLAGER